MVKGGRKKESHRLRWVDYVKWFLWNMGVKRWRARALDRTEWASVLSEAKAKLKGL
jgi:alpha-L-fucosidase